MRTYEPVYLLDGCRSPIGRGHPEKGMYRDLRAEDLAIQVLHALIERSGLDPAMVDDFYLGCVDQRLEQGMNLARLIILLAGLPTAIPGVTVNRLCASGLTSLQLAVDSVRAGTGRLHLVGGVEHMGHVPMTLALDFHPALLAGSEYTWTNMGLTAERLARDFNISRAEQDEFALESNRRHLAARAAGFFRDEIVPIKLPDGRRVDHDESPRLSTPETLASLRPAFMEQGTVTAASSSGISDGACMALVCDEVSLARFARSPLARIISTANVGLDPAMMGLGPVGAIRKLLEKEHLKLDDIGLFEINEAFASQVIACRRALGLPADRLNVNGGAVALGHPLGMSGLRIAVTLAYAMRSRGVHYGIASLCVGHGQGVAMLLEGCQGRLESSGP